VRRKKGVFDAWVMEVSLQLGAGHRGRVARRSRRIPCEDADERLCLRKWKSAQGTCEALEKRRKRKEDQRTDGAQEGGGPGKRHPSRRGRLVGAGSLQAKRFREGNLEEPSPDRVKAKRKGKLRRPHPLNIALQNYARF